MRPAHHDGNSGGANGVGHAIGLGDHASHGADADQPNVFVANILRDLGFVHGLGVAVDQQDFMARRGQRLEQKHPEVRHEVARDPVVGVIEQDFHKVFWERVLPTRFDLRGWCGSRPSELATLLM